MLEGLTRMTMMMIDNKPPLDKGLIGRVRCSILSSDESHIYLDAHVAELYVATDAI
jgi:hypothetical protein